MEPVEEQQDIHAHVPSTPTFDDALRTLLDGKYGTETDAKAALQKFMMEGRSNLHKQPIWKSKASDRWTIPYLCADRKCGFRLLLKYGGKDAPSYMFELGQSSPATHIDHEPTAPVRATAYVAQAIASLIEDEKKKGSQGLDLVNGVVLRATAQGIPTTSRSINDFRRTKEKEQLKAKVFEGRDMCYILKLGEQTISLDVNSMDGSSLDAAAVVGMLRHLQIQQRNAYIRIIVINGLLQYAFWSTELMRELGSLFGEMRLFDDKHNVSNKGYHLAACTVQTNNGCRVVARAYMASSNKENWTQFMRDTKDAFATLTGSPAREYQYSLADGDGVIASAIQAVDPRVLQWSCWYHFDDNTNNQFRRLKSEWMPIHEILQKLMKTSRKEESEILKSEALVKIQALSNEALRQRETEMLEEIWNSRLLHCLLTFTNGWTSQSATESQNAVIQRLQMGASVDLSVATDKLLKYDQKKDTEQDQIYRNTLQSFQKKFFGESVLKVTKEGLERLIREYDLASPLFVQETDAGIHHVTVASKAAPRIVSKDPTTGHYICTCNMARYEGITCRHIQKVLILKGEALDISLVDSRWLRTNLQPRFELMNQSPFLEVTANDVTQTEQRQDAINDKDNNKGKEELNGSEQSVFSNGGHGGMGEYTFTAHNAESQIEGSDEVVVRADGYTIAPAVLRPKELQNATRETSWSIIRRCGSNKTLLLEFQQHMLEWRDKNVPDILSGAISLAAGIGPTTGPPSNPLLLKEPKRSMRSTSVKAKVEYACSNCGKTGHNKSRCRVKRVEPDDGIGDREQIGGTDTGTMSESKKARKGKGKKIR